MEQIKGLFKTKKEAEEFCNANLERKHKNLSTRWLRMRRKANLQEFNYFCTFTYDDKLHTEESFKKKLKKCFQNYSTRYGWRYIGIFELSPENKRVHFHGIFYIPEGTMPGELFKKRDYNFKTKKMQETWQNTFFNKKFGRTDFERINDDGEIGETLHYILKYIEKTGERMVLSRGLPQFFFSDVFEEDIICPLNDDGQKYVLADDFTCIDEGTIMGTVSKEVIKQMRTAS